MFRPLLKILKPINWKDPKFSERLNYPLIVKPGQNPEKRKERGSVFLLKRKISNSRQANYLRERMETRDKGQDLPVPVGLSKGADLEDRGLLYELDREQVADEVQVAPGTGAGK